MSRHSHFMLASVVAFTALTTACTGGIKVSANQGAQAPDVFSITSIELADADARQFLVHWEPVPSADYFSLTVAMDEACINSLVTLKNIAATTQDVQINGESDYFACVYAHKGNDAIPASNNGRKFESDHVTAKPGPKPAKPQAPSPTPTIPSPTPTIPSPTPTTPASPLAVFQSLEWINTAADGFINAMEYTAASPLIGNLVAENYKTAAFALVSEETPCSASLSYEEVPMSNSDKFGLDGSYVVCVLLENAEDVKTFGRTPTAIVFDKTAPIVDAGADSAASGSISRTATLSEDAVVTWSTTSGPGTLTFTAPNDLTTTISADTDGLYTIRVTAQDAAGNHGFDEFSFTKITPDSSAPASATNLKTAAVLNGADVRLANNTEFFMHWDPASDPESGIQGYRVEMFQAAGCSGSPQIISGLTSTNTSYTGSMGVVYSYRVIAINGDGLDATSNCSGFIRLNAPPSITLATPVAGITQVTTTGTFAINWTDNDGDDDAAISLFYKTSATGSCSSGTQIASNLSENANGASGSYNWNVTGVTPGTYYVCARIDDGFNPGSEHWSPGALKINVAPTFAFTAPAASTRVIWGASLPITWNVEDPDNNVTIALYRKTSTSGACSAGTLLSNSLTGADSSYTYNTSATGTTAVQYFCASVSDGFNSAVEVHSGAITFHRICEWNGVTSSTWGTASNWTNCNGGSPNPGDFAFFPTGRPNDPHITTAVNLAGIGGGIGGGTIILAGTGSLNLSNAGSLHSSVRIEGHTDCTSCRINTVGSSLRIYNNATLTLGPRVKVQIGANSRISVGDDSPGHLIADGGPTPEEWPVITANAAGNVFYGVHVIGTSDTERSSIDIDGLKIEGVSSGHHMIALGPYFDIKDLQNVHFDSRGTIDRRSTGGYIKMVSCTGSASVAAWSNLSFRGENLLAAAYHGTSGNGTNIDAVHEDCKPENNFAISVSGDGDSYGPVLERDPQNVISWLNGSSMNCVWTGAVSTSWFNPANWNSCNNSRGNYPDANDWAVIPNEVDVPLLPRIASGKKAFLRGFSDRGASSDGGVITIEPNGTLRLFSRTETVGSSVTIHAASPDCTTCVVDPRISMTIYNDATFRIGSGVRLITGFDSGHGVIVGSGVFNGSTGGRFETEPAHVNPNYWPLVGPAANTRTRLFHIQGVDGKKASAAIDGLRTTSTGEYNYQWVTFFFYSQYVLEKFDNIIMDAASVGTSQGAYVMIERCANVSSQGGSVSDTTWSNIDFVKAPTAGARNIVLNSNCTAQGTINVSPLVGGSNLGYGPDFMSDPSSILNWQ